MKNKWLIAFFLGSSLLIFSQSTNKKAYFSHDVGVFIGGSYYIGDLNPAKQFYMTQPAAGLFYRFNYNYRLAFRGGLNYGNIQGDDSQSSDADQLERNLNFKSKIYEAYVQTEFNFWEYRIGHKNYLFAPYIFLGISVFHFNPQAHVGNQWVNLQELSTEGQKTPLNPTQKPYKLTQVSIPFGIGFNLDLSDYIGLGFEWGPRKTFTDYLDDVGGKYVDPYKLAEYKGGMAAAMSNRAKKSSVVTDDVGKLRGNPATKDWYFFYGLTINFKLKSKPKECKGGFR